MHVPLTFELVNTVERWRELELFAASFDHKIDKTSLTPLIAVSRGKKLFGYFFLLKHQVVIPCFHPEFTQARDFKDMVEQVRAGAWLNTVGDPRFPKGVCYAAFNNPDISRELLGKMGWLNMELGLWQSNPELVTS